MSGGKIFMDGDSTFSIDGVRRWEVLSEDEWVFTDRCRSLRHVFGNSSKIVARSIDIFTVDHIERKIYFVHSPDILVIYDIKTGNKTFEFLSLSIRDIECSNGVCLLYDRDYSIWYKGVKIAETSGLAVIPFLALENKHSYLPFIFLTICALALLAFRICYNPIFFFQLFRDKVNTGNICHRYGGKN